MKYNSKTKSFCKEPKGILNFDFLVFINGNKIYTLTLDVLFLPYYT